MNSYGGLDAPVAAGVLVLFCLYLGLVHAAFGGLFALAAGRLKLGPRALVLAPFLWVALELFRARVIAFPWDLMGTALVDNIPLSRIATITGVYGLSFEVLLVNAAFASVFVGRRERRALVLAGCILLVGILQTGSFFTAPPQPANGTARLVQPNLSLNVDWTPEFYEKTLAELGTLSVPQPGELMPGDPLPDLVIWPESPAPFFENDPRFRNTVEQDCYRCSRVCDCGRSRTAAFRGRSADLQLSRGHYAARGCSRPLRQGASGAVWRVRAV